MNTTLKKLSPYLLILFGLFILFFIGQAILAGICLIIGIVMIIESVWPEEWDSNKNVKL